MVNRKSKVWALAIALLTWILTHYQQLFTVSEVVADWCEITVYTAHMWPSIAGLTDSWYSGAASRHTTALISHTDLHSVDHISTTHFRPAVEAKLAWALSMLATCSRLLAVKHVTIETATSRYDFNTQHLLTSLHSHYKNSKMTILSGALWGLKVLEQTMLFHIMHTTGCIYLFTG